MIGHNIGVFAHSRSLCEVLVQIILFHFHRNYSPYIAHLMSRDDVEGFFRMVNRRWEHLHRPVVLSLLHQRLRLIGGHLASSQWVIDRVDCPGVQLGLHVFEVDR